MLIRLRDAALLSLCVLSSTVATGLLAQVVRVEAGPDPYTKGEAEALAKVGYVRFGPFPFGANHNTRQVEALLGTEPLIWIETRHFRLGCSLPAVQLKKREAWSKEWVESVTLELKELKKLLPTIKRKPKHLDPWLRAHLFAFRLEKLYAEVADNLGFDEPAAGDEDEGQPPPLGKGRYLGMREKFTVLLLQKGSSHARYTRAYHGIELADPLRRHDREFDCMYWGTGEETAERLLAKDLAMHSYLTYNVAHNLYSGYRGYQRKLPPWLVTGLAHWHAWQVTHRYPTYDRRDKDDHDSRIPFWQWDRRVVGMMKNDIFEPLAQFAERRSAGDYGLEQRIQCWAFVDFLLAEHKQEMARFLHLAKEPDLSRQHAFEQAFGHGIGDLDAEWRKHVSKRRRR